MSGFLDADDAAAGAAGGGAEDHDWVWMEAHGCRVRVARRALGLVPSTSRARRGAFWLHAHKRFDALVLAVILYSTLMLALVDYSHVELDGPDAGAPRADGSWRNGLAHKSDFWFCTPFFAAELAVKVGSGARARRNRP